jgi:hypothetical protein
MSSFQGVLTDKIVVVANKLITSLTDANVQLIKGVQDKVISVDFFRMIIGGGTTYSAGGNVHFELMQGSDVILDIADVYIKASSFTEGVYYDSGMCYLLGGSKPSNSLTRGSDLQLGSSVAFLQSFLGNITINLGYHLED